jgi:hypothetical protein
VAHMRRRAADAGPPGLLLASPGPATLLLLLPKKPAIPAPPPLVPLRPNSQSPLPLLAGPPPTGGAAAGRAAAAAAGLLLLLVRSASVTFRMAICWFSNLRSEAAAQRRYPRLGARGTQPNQATVADSNITRQAGHH